jgi:hypothetical protein
MAAYLGDPSASLSLVGHAARLLSWASIAKQPLRRVSGLGRKSPLGGRGWISSPERRESANWCEWCRQVKLTLNSLLRKASAS